MSGIIRPFMSERVQQSRGPVDSVGGRGTGIISLYGPFRAPVTRELRHRILAQLRRGERVIILGTLRIVHTTRWVRELLERAGLFRLLSPARTRSRCRGLRAIAHGVGASPYQSLNASDS